MDTRKVDPQPGENYPYYFFDGDKVCPMFVVSQNSGTDWKNFLTKKLGVDGLEMKPGELDYPSQKQE